MKINKGADNAIAVVNLQIMVTISNFGAARLSFRSLDPAV